MMGALINISYTNETSWENDRWKLREITSFIPTFIAAAQCRSARFSRLNNWLRPWPLTRGEQVMATDFLDFLHHGPWSRIISPTNIPFLIVFKLYNLEVPIGLS